MSTQSSRSRLAALGCVALAGGLLFPPRAFAEPATRSTPILDAARLVAGRQASAMKSRDAGQAPQPAANTDLRSGSFFKSKAGVATLVLFIGGVAYAVYSSNNDRIRSAGR